jgi:hypothetical protein
VGTHLLLATLVAGCARLYISGELSLLSQTHAPLFTAVLRLLDDGRPLSPTSISSSLEAGRLKACERALVGLAT